MPLTATVTGSVGYDGTMYEGGFAQIAPHLGRPPHVGDPADLVVSAASGDRSVTVADGVHFADGVLVPSSSTVTLGSADVVASGSRWDTVAVHRDWTTNTSTLQLVKGGASKALAGGMDNTVGSKKHYPIALVRFQAGATAPQEFIDLRYATMDQQVGPMPEGTGTATSWSIATEQGTVFIAPPSGRIWVDIQAGMTNTSSTFYTLFGFRIYNGFDASGALFADSVEDRSVYARGTGVDVQSSSSFLISGLTPGNAYYVIGAHRVSGGSATFLRRRIGLRPTV